MKTKQNTIENKILNLEERLTKTETSLAFIDDFLQKVQDEALKQWKEIEILQKQNAALHAKIQELTENEEIPNEKPPHY